MGGGISARINGRALFASHRGHSAQYEVACVASRKYSAKMRQRHAAWPHRHQNGEAACDSQLAPGRVVEISGSIGV
jgi:hypothetical protein